jgi:non-ribosomal peptide synthetase component E (peptide arylation enzyme)
MGPFVDASSLLASLSLNAIFFVVSLFGFLSLGLIPIPLIFIRYGEQLRARSRYAQEANVVIARLRAGQDEDKTDVEHPDLGRATFKGTEA